MSDSDESDDSEAERREQREIAARFNERKRKNEEQIQATIDARAVSLGLVANTAAAATANPSIEELYDFKAGQSDKCALCGETTPLNECLYNSSCALSKPGGINKGIRGSHSRHRICKDCWFEGKSGNKPFANEDSDHTNCPGCVKGQKIFTPEVLVPRVEKKLKIVNGIIDLT
jgi:hypothetical protein